MTTTNKKIALFTDFGEEKKLDNVFPPDSRNRLAQRLQILPDLTPQQDLEARKDELATVNFIFSTWGALPLTEEQIKTYFPNLEAFFYGAGSVQGFARPYLHSGVRIFCAAAANAIPVAEYTVAQIILANKGFYQISRLYKEKHWADARALYEHHPGNYNDSVGLIGMGAIARRVVSLLAPYQLSILVYDPYLKDEDARALGVSKTSLQELFERSNTISNHLPNNAETKAMLTYEHFSRMREFATFLNTGRGAQLVEADLARALREVPTRTAVLDVTIEEPLPAEHEFYAMDNIIITPHIAGSYGNELARMGDYMVEECFAFLDGMPLQHEVTLPMLDRMA